MNIKFTVEHHLCRYCGREYFKRRNEQLFCSRICKTKYHNELHYKKSKELANEFIKTNFIKTEPDKEG
jgi:ribosomal protein L37AE/L43A